MLNFKTHDNTRMGGWECCGDTCTSLEIGRGMGGENELARPWLIHDYRVDIKVARGGLQIRGPEA